jgi:hypothetical protein
MEKFKMVLNQIEITEEGLRDALSKSPRRMKLSIEWPEPFHSPKDESSDWSLVLPFHETLANAFDAMCPLGLHIGMRQSSSGRSYTFFSGTCFLKEPPTEAVDIFNTIGQYVALRDCLALSFALDYDREAGNPQGEYTEVGVLRNRAKPRAGGLVNHEIYVTTVQELARRCLDFLYKVTCYSIADGIVAMPSSNPEKEHDIPRDIATIISKSIGIENLTRAVRTVRKRDTVKDMPLEKRIDVIRSSTAINSKIILGRKILLIEDVYQSGSSMNCVAMLLQQGGAQNILGLACDKTSSNTDNIS